jgi:acetate kinase
MNVLVINCGSSSIKYGAYDMPGGQLLGRGMVNRIGQGPSTFKYESAGEERTQQVRVQDQDHDQAVRLVLETILDAGRRLVPGGQGIDVVGHRIVHGGDMEEEAALIDQDLLERVDDFSAMAPLHNPPTLTAIQTAMSILNRVPQVACFDTAFHRTVPEVAYTYALPWNICRQHGVRRYGFHGISFRFVCRRAAEMLHRPVEQLNAIVCHLGSGCSVAAIRGGRSIDTSVGMTPLEALVMGTRAGDVDPGVLFYLMDKGIDAWDLETLMNEQSGLLGVSGISADMRDLCQAARQGEARAKLAVDVFCYHLKKYIGAYMAIIDELHAVVFTGGIGENAAAVRRGTCEDLRHLGIEIDPGKNDTTVGRPGDITTGASRIRVLVVPTNEELAIAAAAHDLVTAQSGIVAG